LFKRLGASDVQIGLIASIFWAGWLVLQPVSLFLFARRRRTKTFLIPWSLTFAVLPYVAVAWVIYALAATSPALCVTLILVILTVRVVGAGMGIPFWLDWQSMIFRQEIRGRVIGMMATAAPIGAAAATYSAGLVVESMGYPANYSAVAAAGVVFFLIALAVLSRVKEPESLRAPYTPLRPGDLFRRFRHSLSEVNFRRYLIGRILMTLGAGGAAFYAVHFQGPAGGSVPEATVIKLSSLLLVGQCLVSYPLGRLGDRMGHKVGVVLGAFGQVAAILVAFLGRGPVACGAAFALCGVAWAAAWVCHVNMLFETCPHDSRVAHITLSNMVLGPILALVPVATGWVVKVVDTRPGIGLTLIPTLLGVLWLAVMVREPRDIEIDRRPAPDDLAPPAE
jgi:MFS family permease